MVYNRYTYSRFINRMYNKYNGKIRVGEYIMERLLYKRIDTIFGYKKDLIYNDIKPFTKCIENNDDFNIVYNDYNETVSKNALMQSRLNNSIGVVVSSLNFGMPDINSILYDGYTSSNPLLLLTFYDFKNEFKNPIINIDYKYLKLNYTANSAKKIPYILEDLMWTAETSEPGHVYLNIYNDIVSDMINFNEIESYP